MIAGILVAASGRDPVVFNVFFRTLVASTAMLVADAIGQFCTVDEKSRKVIQTQLLGLDKHPRIKQLRQLVRDSAHHKLNSTTHWLGPALSSTVGIAEVSTAGRFVYCVCVSVCFVYCECFCACLGRASTI